MNDQTQFTRCLSADELAAIGFTPLKTQAEIDAEFLLPVVTWGAMLLAGAAFWLGVAFCVVQAIKAAGWW